MPESIVGGGSGNITIAGVGGNLTGWSLEARQQVDDATSYKDTTAARHHGSGVTAFALDFTGVMSKGAAGDKPGLSSLTADGVAVVATASVGCTYTGNFVVESIRLDHRKVSGTNPISGRALNDGSVAEAWVEGA